MKLFQTHELGHGDVRAYRNRAGGITLVLTDMRDHRQSTTREIVATKDEGVARVRALREEFGLVTHASPDNRDPRVRGYGKRRAQRGTFGNRER